MRTKAKKSQGGGTDQEGVDPDRQNKPCSIVEHEGKMNPKLLCYSVSKQRDILRQSKRIVRNRDERTGYLLELLELVEDKEQLVECDRQLREVRDKRERAVKFAAIIKENLKQIKVGKLEAELRKAHEELAEEERKAAKKKADETTATKAKAAQRRAKKAKAAASAAVKKGEVERRRRIREERAADQAAARHAAEQAAAETKAAERVREAAEQKKGSDTESSCRGSDMSGDKGAIVQTPQTVLVIGLCTLF